MRGVLVAGLVVSIGCMAQAQVSSGQTDTFASNTQNWSGANPSWISSGGAGGATDGFLQLISVGGVSGANSKMAGYNTAQWSGNYTAAGVGAISVDFNNLAQNALEMRLVFFDAGASTQWVSSASAVLPASPGWNHFVFTIDPAQFVRTSGTSSFAATLGSAGRMMFRHDPGPPSSSGVMIAATLGVDNVHAVPVPEPASICAVSLGILALVRRRRRQT